MMYIAAGYLTLDTGECSSLKEKRSIVRSLIDKAKAKFAPLSIAEVGNADSLKKATIGASVISNDKEIAAAILCKVLQYLEENSFRTIFETQTQIFAL